VAVAEREKLEFRGSEAPEPQDARFRVEEVVAVVDVDPATPTA
jgi:hypothetical protein